MKNSQKMPQEAEKAEHEVVRIGGWRTVCFSRAAI
jgi:hypothetical protein